MEVTHRVMYYLTHTHTHTHTCTHTIGSSQDPITACFVTAAGVTGHVISVALFLMVTSSLERLRHILTKGGKVLDTLKVL